MKTEELADRREKETRESTTWKLATHNKRRIERTERHVLWLLVFSVFTFFTLTFLILILGGVI